MPPWTRGSIMYPRMTHREADASVHQSMSRCLFGKQLLQLVTIEPRPPNAQKEFAASRRSNSGRRREKGSRSQVEGAKHTERFEIEHGPRSCQRQLDGDDYGSGVEVSGSAVAVTRESRQLWGCESWHPFQPLPVPRCYREVHALPREGTSDASHQIASVCRTDAHQTIGLQVRGVTTLAGGVRWRSSFCPQPVSLGGCP